MNDKQERMVNGSEKLSADTQRRYPSLEKITQVGVWEIDAQARTVFANERMAQMLGYSKDEMIGHHLFEFMDDEWKETAKVNLARRQQGIVEQHEFCFRKKDGASLWALLATSPLTDAQGKYRGAVAEVIDITALKGNEERFRNLVEASPNPIIETDERGRITYWSPAAVALFGFTPDEVLGKTLVETIVPERYREAKMRGFEAFAKTGQGPVVGKTNRVEGLKKDGSLVPLAYTVSAFESAEGWRAVGILEDLTELEKERETVQKHLAELEARQHIIDSMLRTFDLDERLDIALQEMMSLLEAEKGVIRLIEGNRSIVRRYVGYSEEFIAKVRDLPLAQIPWHDRLTCSWREDVATLLPDEIISALRDEGIRGWISIPINTEERSLGMLIVSSTKYGAFSDDDIRKVSASSNAIALMFEHARLHRQAQERLARLTTLREIDRAITANLSLDGIIKAVLKEALPHMPVDAVGLSLMDWERKRTVLAYLQTAEGASIEGESFALADSLLDQLGIRKETVIIYDVQADPRMQNHREIIRKHNLRSYVGVPLVVQGSAIGVLHLFTTKPRVLGGEVIEFFQTLAGQAAISVQNAQLYKRSVEQYRGMRALADITLEIQTGGFEEMVATHILQVAQQVTGADFGSFFSYDKSTRSLRLTAETGLSVDEATPKGEMPSFPLGEERGLVGLVAYTRKPLYISDVRNDPRWFRTELPICSAYWVPLYHGETLFGVYALGSRGVNGFVEEQMALADTLGSYVSTALENARLFQETRRAYEELRDTQQQLIQAQKMESIGRLAGGVAHDFNNLLTAISGYTELTMMVLTEDSPLYGYLREVQNASERASNLTRQLLLFSRREPMEMAPVDLNRQIRELQKMLGRIIGEDIAVNLELAENLWAINADAGNIDQVIINLAVNARDAMPHGGTLTIKTENTIIDEEHSRRHPRARTGNFARLTVSDTGVGMDESTMEQIFEPFFSTKKEKGGTGLGLSVVYGIVESHEGWIEVESEVNKGATFTIYLPALMRPASDEEDKTTVSINQFRGQGERILLTEDDTTLRILLEQTLNQIGYTVFPCANIVDTLKIFEQEKGQFDLIVSDVVLPDGRGTDLVLQFLEKQPSLPVLLMSGYTDDRSEWERIRRRGLPFIRKTFSITDFLAQVKNLLKKG
ncbi:TPA: PAS domain S-box protein [Candidatus Poribacteria bacterium]|nr:PAS domain S-box protein [Candidatus Poribacteria bacterium]